MSLSSDISVSLPNDQYGRAVTMVTTDGQDVYTIDNGGGTTFTISFPTGTNQAQVYSSINAQQPPGYVPPIILAQAQMNQITAFSTAMMAYANSCYPLQVQVSFLCLWIMAQQAGRTNQMAYIQPLFTFANSLLGYNAEVIGGIMAMTDATAVQSLTWDIAGNTMADPQVSLIEAAAITN